MIYGLILILLVIYFIPTALAVYKKHDNINVIIIMNVLLGWSMIGWFVVMYWANTNTEIFRKK